MTRRTPEYIEHLMARPEFRRRLNEEWEPEVGDWVWLLQDHEVALVYRFALGVVDSLITEGNETRFDGRGRHGCCWLPSLSQLLDMVVEASAAQKEPSEDILLHYAYELSEWATVEFWVETKRDGGWHDEPEIAAASLLAALWGVG